ncbi:hypothetical protein OS190_08420 [Sulfitobacter sp. F26204]|uniref:hypothetical protein n=1 Tax=Sulfitobacter sp. F26204 TaxID=2996014 RepID=UPI00225E600A|nr:hypothetical protein [Sulfitobacter sp. F26204]MCX7559594.1 hypothetical protein [Sulfitobacter sp. F26204]
MTRIALLLALLLLAACAPKPPAPATPRQITALALALRQMSPDVDPTEATIAARLSYATSRELARAYHITDSPLIHNAKVNAGTRPRGLCYHWAEDMQARLEAEGFHTLDVTRAIANSDALFLIEHSTAVLTPKGAKMEDGVVIDPWRKGGTLFWSPVTEDRRYDWLPRAQVLRDKGRIHYVHRTKGSLAAPPAE